MALIRKLWKPLLGDILEQYLLIASEILQEEELAIWMQFHPRGATIATAEVPDYSEAAHEYEKFS